MDFGLSQGCVRPGLTRVDRQVCFRTADVTCNEHCQLQVTYLSCRVSFAVWLRCTQCVIQDVQVADHRNEERMVNSNVVSNRTLDQRDDCAAHDGHVQNAGSISCQRTELSHSQTEDCWKHDGIEKANSQDAPHGEVPVREH